MERLKVSHLMELTDDRNERQRKRKRQQIRMTALAKWEEGDLTGCL
jgi:hypothetical protein